MSDMSVSFETNLAHLERLVAKRDRIAEAINDTRDALLSVAVRMSFSPEDATELWTHLRTLEVKGLSGPFADATGYGSHHLKMWRDNPPPAPGQVFEGSLPVGWDVLPRKGTPCVYVLLDDDMGSLYIGQTQNIKVRLTVHWREKRIPVTRYHVVACESVAAARELEGDLIFQHQPCYNRVGRKQRAKARVR